MAIHIGVNTCKFGVVTQSMLRQLIRKLKHVFPEAAVLVSSIDPPMLRQLIRKLKHVFPEAAVLVSSIDPPMRRLRQSATRRRHQLPITPTPSLHLYRDQLYPSDGGTSRLVFNLQLATVARRRQARRHQPSSHPQDRQDPVQRPPSPGSPPPAKFSFSTERRPGTASTATGRNPTTPCSQTFAVGTCAARCYSPHSAPLAGFMELTTLAESDSITAVCSRPVLSCLLCQT